MTYTVSRVLEHPSLAAARPVLRAGRAGAGRRVRWIHSSEVLEIAPLLRGGELLLTGGHQLGRAVESEQRRYVRELAERQVAAVAIETGPALPRLSDALLEEADAAGFPVVELRSVVPFVSVAEAINAELVNESVTRLRLGGELAHALARILADGGGLQALVEELQTQVGCPVALLDGAGVRLASAGLEAGDPAAGAEVSTRITLRGAHAATLTFHSDRGDDQEWLAVAGDRASEALGLALLRTRPPSPRDLAASELVRLASAGAAPERLRRLGEAVGLRAGDPVVAMVAQGSLPGRAGLAGLDGVVRRHGELALDAAESQSAMVLSLSDRRRAPGSRAGLLADLADWASDLDGVVVAVGPVMPRLTDASASMRTALLALQRRPAYGAAVVVDTTETMLADLWSGEERRTEVETFVRAQLGMVLALGRREAATLLETLDAYFESGCQKTRTARVLHLQRQSLYARLERAFAAVGGDPTGTPRALALHLALRLRHGRHLTVDART